MKPLLKDTTELKIPGHLLRMRYTHAESVEAIQNETMGVHLRFALLQLQATAVGQTRAIQHLYLSTNLHF